MWPDLAKFRHLVKKNISFWPFLEQILFSKKVFFGHGAVATFKMNCYRIFLLSDEWQVCLGIDECVEFYWQQTILENICAMKMTFFVQFTKVVDNSNTIYDRKLRLQIIT